MQESKQQPISNSASGITPEDRPASAGKGSTRIGRRGRRTAIVVRSLLLLFFATGFFCSIVPWGRATVRAAFLLPALVAATEPLPLIATGEPIQHSQMTVPSRSGTVYLDIYAPASSSPLV